MRAVLIAIVLAALSTAASAQYDASDPRSNIYNNESLRRQDEIKRNEEAARSNQNAEQTYGSKPSSPSGGSSAGTGPGGTDYRALGKELLRLPPLPVERNVLLGSWRVEGGGQQSGVLEFGLTGRGATPGMGEMMGFLKSIETGQLTCDMSFGRGVTFTPTTFSSGGAAGMVGGPVAYRSRKKGVIVAIPGDSRANPMFFEIVGPDRIVAVNVGCPLVRVGAPAANAASNAATAPGNARAGASGPSAPPATGALPQVAAVAPAPTRSTLERPSPEVCRNRLLDKLGVVGVNQVRAMSDARFRETTIEGKVPNTNNLRLDLRGSACDDPRIKATLYDFDANGMLESITYVWDRPAGPAPAPIFSERVTHLTRVLSLPPPQSPGRLQADTSVGRLILQDMPERNLMLEAYKAKK
ncbi:MAG: hypothetical protein ACREBN_06255 [Burkholderiaceae bacterium]